MYGCSGIMITDVAESAIVMGHLQQVSGTGCININDPTSVNNWIERLRLATDAFDPSSSATVDLLYDDTQGNSPGLESIKTWLKNEWNYQGVVGMRPYPASSGTGEPDRNSPRGLAAVQWIPGQPGTLTRYFDMEEPLKTPST